MVYRFLLLTRNQRVIGSNPLGTRQEFIPSMLLALKGCMRANAGVIMPGAHRDNIWKCNALHKN